MALSQKARQILNTGLVNKVYAKEIADSIDNNTIGSATNGTYSGTLGVTGAVTFSSTLAVTGAATLSSTLAVTGLATLTAGLINNGIQTDSVGSSTAGAGTTVADAGALPAGTAKIYPTTGANDTVGVKIHANDKVTGRHLFIGNGVSNKILKVYGPSGATINGAAGDAAFSSASGKGVDIVCLSGAGNTWLAN